MGQKLMSDDLLTHLLNEAMAYSTLEEIEKLVEQEGDLSCIPIQPLYLSLKASTIDLVAGCLSKISEEQRQILLDLDLWEKDSLDLDSFHFWLQAYFKCPDQDTQFLFASSEQFLVYLKGKFHISTFDLEEPEYPDHDNYFLTDDNLLLFEFDDEFPYAHEVQSIIRVIYAELGVERAYSHLFKLVSDSFLVLQEEEYQLKNSRLRDYGLVDYYSSLEIYATFPNHAAVNNFIKTKVRTTGRIDELGTNQTLHSTSLRAYTKGLESIKDELSKVKDSKRKDYLQFNFIRLVNASLSFHGALKSGSLAMSKVGTETRSLILLGYNYIKGTLNEGDLAQERFQEGVFGCFEFVEIYKIGHSLMTLGISKIKKALALHEFDKEERENFLGGVWEEFLEDSFSSPAKYSSAPLESKEALHQWENDIKLFCSTLAFIKKFHDALEGLKKEEKIRDDFYLNYQVDGIDFEAILISSFINFSLGKYQDPNTRKMGITIKEFKKFLGLFGVEGDKTQIKPMSDPKLSEKIREFKETFGFGSLVGFEGYFYRVLSDQINGYELSTLSYEDYAHVGGPILLKVEEF